MRLSSLSSRGRRELVFLCLLFAAFASTAPARGESPYRRDRLRDGLIVSTGTLGVIGAFFVEGSNDNHLSEAEIRALSRDDVNAFDRSATYRYSDSYGTASDVIVAAAIAAPLAFLASGETHGDWRTYSLMYVETMTFAAVLPALAKGSAERIRPFVYNPDAPLIARALDDPKGSFFSRHTSLAFASAVFLASTHDAYHPESTARPYVWAGSLLAAAAVGWMRYEAGEHFPTDIITGALVGSAIGYAVPRLHRAGEERLSLVPCWNGARAGLALEVRI